MKKGDIILIPFPFTDLSGSKNRPAVVLCHNHLDVIVAFISTQLKWQENTDLNLYPTPENGIKKESIIRTNKIMTLDKSMILGKIGNLSAREMKQLNICLIELLSLK